MTYEYVCQACDHHWEAQQPISAEPLKDCPACGRAEAKRQISLGGGFILKGGGWYSDLYSSTGSGKSQGADSSSSNGGAASKNESKSESKKGSKSSDSATASPASSSSSKTSDSSAA